LETNLCVPGVPFIALGFFAGINATVFKITYTSEYYTNRTKLRRKKHAKLSIGAAVLEQIIICNVKVSRARTGHDRIDFKPIATKILEIKKLSVVVADKVYDSEDNHILERKTKRIHYYTINV